MRTLRLPCLDSDSAEKCVIYMRETEQIDVDGTDGRDVLIPWGGDVRFAVEIAELAAQQGFIEDDLSPVLRQIETPGGGERG